ncbi:MULTISPECIES: hypothetical protein [Bradyrhizobium]|uniref:Uncharacterized protein n=1 Tax=Bradyrhizobium vignae TaxID=1549949 RepID=A0ABS4A793_9BRAD|nr:hypothetical protein [Bradyrhizobium vignae]MBP0116273.1 hypothetical protein [Bradyrhizobium vignae]
MGDLLGTVGKIAGIGGIALGVLLVVFRDVLRKSIFSKLPAAETYKLIRLLVVLTFAVACLGIFAWLVGSGVFVQITNGDNSGIFNFGRKS